MSRRKSKYLMPRKREALDRAEILRLFECDVAAYRRALREAEHATVKLEVLKALVEREGATLQ